MEKVELVYKGIANGLGFFKHEGRYYSADCNTYGRKIGDRATGSIKGRSNAVGIEWA